MLFLVLHVVLSLLLDLAHALTRSDYDKTVELLLLRQELRLYERKSTQPRVSRWEKVPLACLAARLPDLSRVALVFSPATLLRWHREIVRRKWTFDNRPRRGRPPISAACVELMLRLTREYPRRGCGMIQGELRKLGHRIPRSAIKHSLRQHGLPPAPERDRSAWRDFLGHYHEYMVACDFFTVDTVFLRRLSILFFIELGSRRVHLAGCTTNPDAAWVTQQARQFAWHLQEREPGSVQFLLHDRDGIFATGFDTVFASDGIEVIRTPARHRTPTPSRNGWSARSARSAWTTS